MMKTSEAVGHYFIVKYANRVAESGYFVTAKQMRKQGIPLNVAMLILLNKTISIA